MLSTCTPACSRAVPGLCVAVSARWADGVRLLVRYEVDVDVVDAAGCTPLLLAVRLGDPDVVSAQPRPSPATCRTLSVESSRALPHPRPREDSSPTLQALQDPIFCFWVKCPRKRQLRLLTITWGGQVTLLLDAGADSNVVAWAGPPPATAAEEEVEETWICRRRERPSQHVTIRSPATAALWPPYAVRLHGTTALLEATHAAHVSSVAVLATRGAFRPSDPAPPLTVYSSSTGHCTQPATSLQHVNMECSPPTTRPTLSSAPVKRARSGSGRWRCSRR